MKHARKQPRTQVKLPKVRSLRELLWTLSVLLCAAMFCYSAYQLYAYWREGQASDSYTDQLVQQTVVQRQPESEPEKEKERAPIEVDFAALQAQNPDVVGWLYCEDTPINYPIAQAADNDYYLHRLLDGTDNKNGTLFMDYRNRADFSDGNTLVYGHNMKSGKMFGTLTDYRAADYYEKHPVMYLLTPQGDYKIELAAGCVVDETDAVYTAVPSDAAERQQHFDAMMRRSNFESGIELSAEDTVITLSTCSYETETARYVLLGRLVKLEN